MFCAAYALFTDFFTTFFYGKFIGKKRQTSRALDDSSSDDGAVNYKGSKFARNRNVTSRGCLNKWNCTWQSPNSINYLNGPTNHANLHGNLLL